MNRPRTALIGFAIVAAVALLGWYSISQSSDNSPAGSAGGMTMTQSAGTNDGMGGMSMGNSGSTTGMRPLVGGADGTSPSAGGLTLEPRHAVVGADEVTNLQLRVERNGRPVTTFEKDQTKYMHLIVVRSDLSGYQHLHPALGGDGVFTVPLRLPQPGTYRAIADFTTDGKRYALGVAIRVPGRAAPTPPPAEGMKSEADGYQVMVMHQTLKAGSGAQLDFTISRNGAPVTALLPYLGAYGHLVALRKPTLAYSHVHPTFGDRSKTPSAGSDSHP